MPAKPIGWTVCSPSGRSLLSVSALAEGAPASWIPLREAVFGLSNIGERSDEVVHYGHEENAQEAARRVGGVAIGLYAIAEPAREAAACRMVEFGLRLVDPHNFGPATPSLPGRALTPEQKRAIIERVLVAWERKPQLRLGQLVNNVIAKDVSYAQAEKVTQRLYFIEDEALAELLEKGS